MHRPPPVQLAAYRLLGWRLGPSYGDWVHDDLTRRGWFLRAVVPPVVLLYAVGAVVADDPARLLALVAVVTGGLAFLRGAVQQRLLEHHGKDASLRDTALVVGAALAVVVLVAARS